MAASKEASFDWLVNTVSKQRDKKKKASSWVYVRVRACVHSCSNGRQKHSLFTCETTSLNPLKVTSAQKNIQYNLCDAQRDRKKNTIETRMKAKRKVTMAVFMYSGYYFHHPQN